MPSTVSQPNRQVAVFHGRTKVLPLTIFAHDRFSVPAAGEVLIHQRRRAGDWDTVGRVCGLQPLRNQTPIPSVGRDASPRRPSQR